MTAAQTAAFDHLGVALAFGLTVTCCVASMGGLSGAHINPAVTIGLWSVKRFRGRDVVPYVGAQCVGAVVASVFCRWVAGSADYGGATVPAVPLVQAFALEAGCAGWLGFVIVRMAADRRASGVIAPLAIGFAVFVGALVTGPLTGGSFNPARSLGPAVAGGIWTAHWLYWVAPVLGMITAMWLHEWVRETEVPRSPSSAFG